MKKSAKKKSSPKRVSTKKIVRGGGSKKIIILVAVLLFIAVGAYFFLGKSGIALPVVGRALNPNCELKDPELCKFMNNWKDLKNYSVSSVSSGGGESMENTTEIDGSGNTHIVSKNGGKEMMEMIMIGKTTYTKDLSDGKWWKVTAEDTDTKAEDYTKDFKFDESTESEDKTTYKFIAKETCGDHMCFKYEIVSPDSQDGTNYIWFDDREYLLRKMTMTNADGSYESTFSYGGVKISEPSPVKEGTPDMGAGMGMPAMSNEQKAAMQEAQNALKNYQQENNSAPAEDTSDTGETPTE